MALFYITRDVERATGLLGVRKDYYVITNPSPLAETMKAKYEEQVTVIPHRRGQACLTPTIELVRSEHVQKKIQELSQGETSQILVFKTSPQIERECTRLGWKLINPSYEVGAVLEEKILQWKWLQSFCHSGAEQSRAIESRSYQSLLSFQDDKIKFELPYVWTGQLFRRSYKELSSELGERPMVQFNRGHTGLGTLRLVNEEQWKDLQKRFPKREVKVARWYEGKMYTVNAVVCAKSESGITNFGIVIGNISKQLTGTPGCTNNPYATVGNDWSEGSRLREEIKKKINSCAQTVGHALAKRGYAGMFGIDIMLTKYGKVILIEVNPRQLASASLESQLQQERGDATMMEQHLKVLLKNQNTKFNAHNCDISSEHFQIYNSFHGFQIFFRNTEPHAVKLTREFASGRYRISHTGFEFVARAISVNEANRNEVFAFSSPKGVLIPRGGELLRIQSRSDIIDTFEKDCVPLMKSIRIQIAFA